MPLAARSARTARLVRSSVQRPERVFRLRFGDCEAHARPVADSCEFRAAGLEDAPVEYAAVRIDLTGRRFGRFVVLAEVGSDKHKQRIWLCICDCGSHFTRTGSNILAVTRGTAVGTGCLKCANKATGRARTTHGGASRTNGVSAIYKRWSRIKARCTNSRSAIWKYYGGKGIKLCEEWQSFEAFRAWAIASGFRPGLTIDRKDANGNYEPNNCEWVTMAENRRRMHLAHGHAVH